MLFEIRGREFKIDFVNNWVTRRYGEMTQLSYDLADLVSESDITNLKEARIKMNKIKDEIVGIREEMLEELLTTNGYEYDKEWWDRKAGPDDVNKLVVESIRGEVPETKPSKKK